MMQSCRDVVPTFKSAGQQKRKKKETEVGEAGIQEEGGRAGGTEGWIEKS